MGFFRWVFVGFFWVFLGGFFWVGFLMPTLLLALSWPLLHSHGPFKHFHASATVSRPQVALSRAIHIQALPLALQHFYGLYMQSHGLSCEILPTILQNIYIFTAHIVQTNFLKETCAHLLEFGRLDNVENLFQLVEKHHFFRTVHFRPVPVHTNS